MHKRAEGINQFDIFHIFVEDFSELKSFAFSELYSKKPKSEIYPKMPKFEQLEK